MNKKIWPVFFGILLIGFLIVIFLKFSDLEELLSIIKQASWYYLLILVVIECCYFYIDANTFQSIFNIFKVNPKIFDIIKISLSANFTNLVIPSAGISGLTFFAQASKQLNIKRSQGLVVNYLFNLAKYGSFTIIMFTGIIFLFTVKKLESYHYLSSLVLFVCVLIGFYIFFMGLKNKRNLKKLLTEIAKIINFFSKMFIKKNLVEKEHIDTIHKEMVYSATAYKKDIHNFFEPLAFALIGHLTQIAIFYLSFLCFGVNPELYVVIVGYVFCIIFSFISITPSGIGIVEPIIILTISSLGVPIEQATLAVLVYRGISFWLPFIVGFFTSSTIGKKQLTNK